MTQESLPIWLQSLNEEDLQFIRRFILASGSLKELAKEYGISYPTVRSRLDRLIGKVKAAEAAFNSNPFERELQVLVADGQLAPGLARQLIAAYRKSLEITQGEKS